MIFAVWAKFALTVFNKLSSICGQLKLCITICAFLAHEFLICIKLFKKKEDKDYEPN